MNSDQIFLTRIKKYNFKNLKSAPAERIDFHNSTTDKPANLANSAVLRMLEEEERTRRGYPKLDPTQVEAILDTLVYRNRQFEFYWPRNRSAMRSARSWDGQLNVDSAVYPEFLNATKGIRGCALAAIASCAVAFSA
ncbi:hypothetical protein EVAR_49164_1 [Eumeta japonica]|uniref:Uncharacterized protein n=1 Tax=Eumeta variegata TaxID=151549 RepID=A0A4C1YIY1_EUMVA|nr:hypothetical protein EVAR_49164_1 [Eumeta japonica]